MLGFRLDRSPTATRSKRELYERHRIEVPIFETPQGWVLRVSVQAYNDDGDIDALLRALA